VSFKSDKIVTTNNNNFVGSLLKKNKLCGKDILWSWFLCTQHFWN